MLLWVHKTVGDSVLDQSLSSSPPPSFPRWHGNRKVVGEFQFRGCSAASLHGRVLKSATHPFKQQLFSQRRKACTHFKKDMLLILSSIKCLVQLATCLTLYTGILGFHLCKHNLHDDALERRVSFHFISASCFHILILPPRLNSLWAFSKGGEERTEERNLGNPTEIIP